MGALTARISYRLRTEAFRLFNLGKFGRLGRGALMCRSVRVDGPRSMEIGAHTIIQERSWLYAEGTQDSSISLRIGEGCAIGYGNHFAAVRDVTIGNNVLTANNVYISDNAHSYEDITLPILKQPVAFRGAVSIGDGTWLGENVCVIAARVGRNCAIGANAVVTHDIPDYSVAVGIPAKVIRRFDPESKTWVSVGGRVQGESPDA